MRGFFTQYWQRFQGKRNFPHALVYGNVHQQAHIDEGAWIPFGTSIGNACTIGKYSYIMPETYLQNVHIGNFCSLAENVYLVNGHHNAEAFSTFPFSRRLAMHNIIFPEMFEECLDKGVIKIGHDVWIGANCCIMGGVEIGTGAIIGTGSVVTKDVAPYSVVAGTPAREIKKRFSDVAIEKLLSSNWWDWSLEEIQARKHELAELTRE